MEFGLVGLWTSMGMIAKLVVIILVILSIYSLTLSGERWWRYRAAKKQSLQFALLTTQYLKQDRPQDAIAASKKFKASHLAKVVAAGLLEFMVEEQNSPLTGYDVIEAARRAIERATLMTTADFKRGLGGLATIGATSPVHRPLRNRHRHHQRVPRHGHHRLGRPRAQFPRVSRKPSSPPPSASSSPSRPCGCTTTS